MCCFSLNFLTMHKIGLGFQQRQCCHGYTYNIREQIILLNNTLLCKIEKEK